MRTIKVGDLVRRHKMHRTPKVGDLVRGKNFQTSKLIPWNDALAVVTAVYDDIFYLRCLSTGDTLEGISKHFFDDRFELPEETQDAHNCG